MQKLRFSQHFWFFLLTLSIQLWCGIQLRCIKLHKSPIISTDPLWTQNWLVLWDGAQASDLYGYLYIFDIFALGLYWCFWSMYNSFKNKSSSLQLHFEHLGVNFGPVNRFLWFFEISFSHAKYAQNCPKIGRFEQKCTKLKVKSKKSSKSLYTIVRGNLKQSFIRRNRYLYTYLRLRTIM